MDKKKKPIYKKWWFWLVAFLVFGFVVGQTSDDKPQTDEVAEVEEKKEEPKKETNDKAVKKKEKEKADKEKKEREEKTKYGIKLWEEDDGTKDFLIDMHKDNGMVDVGPNNDDYSVMNVVVADELRLLTDEEKEYLINEMGTGVKNMVSSTFEHLDDNDNPQVHVNFIYPNQETAATQKMSGGWKVK